MNSVQILEDLLENLLPNLMQWLKLLDGKNKSISYLGFALRTIIVYTVYSTNEASLHKQIDFHHEMALLSFHNTRSNKLWLKMKS